MTTLKPYFYYSKNDLNKEPIDRVMAMNEKDAIIYFTDRKKLNEDAFKQLYTIEKHEATELK
jgi:hypothetical protein